MSIFTDIYNTVAKFFRQSEEPVIGEASKAVAANRLRLVLMQDRTNLTPRVLEQMRSELVDLLSKYLEMDKDLLELNFEQEGDQVALMLSIPVIRAKDEDEIEAMLASESESSEDEDDNLEDSDPEDSEENEEIISESSEESEVVEEAPKPKRRRPKKVTPPEGMESSGANDDEESSNEEHSEHAEIEG